MDSDFLANFEKVEAQFFENSIRKEASQNLNWIRAISGKVDRHKGISFGLSTTESSCENKLTLCL